VRTLPDGPHRRAIVLRGGHGPPTRVRHSDRRGHPRHVKNRVGTNPVVPPGENRPTRPGGTAPGPGVAGRQSDPPRHDRQGLRKRLAPHPTTPETTDLAGTTNIHPNGLPIRPPSPPSQPPEPG